MRAARFEIEFEVHYVFISQKLKKLIEEKSLPLGPSCDADFL
jgi:hypothetical protein